MKYKAVLFDLDGTLLDTIDDLAGCTNAALARRGLPQHGVAQYKYFVGDGLENLILRVLPEGLRGDGTLVRELMAMQKEEYGGRWSQRTVPYAGIPELVDDLERRGVRLAVLSNKPEQFTKLMVEHYFPRAPFAAVAGAKPDVPHKPDPAGAIQIARDLGVPPAEFLYLGDTNTDMKTAVSAGMFAVGALWGFRTADELLANGAKVLVKTPQEVLKLL